MAQPTTAEPPGYLGAGAAGSAGGGGAQPGDVHPGRAQPGDVRPGTVHPGTVHPGTVHPAPEFLPPLPPSRVASWWRPNRESVIVFVLAMVIVAVAQIVNLAGPSSPGLPAVAGTPGTQHVEGGVPVVLGRVIVAVSTLVTAALLWPIARDRGLGRVSAGLVIVVFGLSPLGLELHRDFTLANPAAAVLTGLVALVLWRRAEARTGRLSGGRMRAVTGIVALLLGVIIAMVMLSSVLALVAAGAGLPGGAGAGVLADVPAAEAFGGWLARDPVLLVATAVAAVASLAVARLRMIGAAVLAATLLAGVLMLAAPSFVPASFLTLLLPFAALLVVGVAAAAGRATHPSTPRSTTRSTTPQNAHRVAGIVGVAAVVVAVTMATSLWPRQVQQVVVGAPGPASGSAGQQNLSAPAVTPEAPGQPVSSPPAAEAQSPSASQSAASAAPATPAAPASSGAQSAAAAPSAAPSAPADGTPADFVDALTPVRASAGEQLAENPALTLEPHAEELLADGQVDARILLDLGLLLSDHTVTVADFPADDDGVSDPRSQVLITAVDGVELDADAQARVDGTALLLTFSSLTAPTRVTVADEGILAQFDGAEPAGLLPTPAPAPSASATPDPSSNSAATAAPTAP
ncbi:hypothetical protein [Subtercola sp. YIM 133946]|uniref:hypothetical protein n=1 Tax=Subtercola sp. YIM 133946 TaxID=3118909 RepID=UPI002F932EF2